MRTKESYLIIFGIIGTFDFISASELGTPRLSQKECGSPQGGVLDFLTFIGISTNIVISAISAINSINSNNNNNNNNDNKNNNNNNNQNDNDNDFMVSVTNERRKKKLKRNTHQNLLEECSEKWICRNWQKGDDTDLDKLIKFFLVVGLGKTWNIDVQDLSSSDSDRCLSNTCFW